MKYTFSFGVVFHDSFAAIATESMTLHALTDRMQLIDPAWRVRMLPDFLSTYERPLSRFIGQNYAYRIYEDDSTSETDRIFSQLKSINVKLQTMATKADLEAGLQKVSDALTNISGDLKSLADQVKAGGLSQADLDEISTKISAVADKAEALAAINPETPTPPSEG